MRRIAKIGVALAAAGAVVGLTAGPASASAGKWTSWGKAGSNTNAGGVAAWGTWSKNSSHIYVNGYVKDTARDGRMGAVLVVTANKSGAKSRGLFFYNTHGAGTTDRFAGYYKSPNGYTAAAYVKECVGYPSGSQFKATKCAKNFKRIV